ncbi:hypothetical protein [Bacteroides sp.]|uniref:hypothetical protein n=1 Tax=Bacteroides sp. TaxID=29523 RepID=UPI003AB7CC27
MFIFIFESRIWNRSRLSYLEKAFLLSEEYQRNSPRAERMGRHLYDLIGLMNIPFAAVAPCDKMRTIDSEKGLL